MEFKGTKGKWFACCMKNTPHFIFANEGDVTICKPYQKQDLTNLSDEEFRSNVLLISKAPEMLEMLNWFAEYFTDLYHEGTEVDCKVLEAKKLIKESTEL